MGYILVYDYLNTMGDYDTWRETFDEFETYEELITYMAKAYPNEHEWKAIFKTEENMLDLYMEDVEKEKKRIVMENIERIQKKKELEFKLAEERRIREEKELEDREIALLRELIKKYGDLV